MLWSKMDGGDVSPPATPRRLVVIIAGS